MAAVVEFEIAEPTDVVVVDDSCDCETCLSRRFAYTYSYCCCCIDCTGFCGFDCCIWVDSFRCSFSDCYYCFLDFVELLLSLSRWLPLLNSCNRRTMRRTTRTRTMMTVRCYWMLSTGMLV